MRCVNKEALATGAFAEATRSDAIGGARGGSTRPNPLMNKFNGSGQMDDTRETVETDGADDYPDDVGLAGMAVGVTRLDGTTTPGIVRGTRDVQVDEETLATRVIVEVEDGDHPLDTDAERVEVI